MDEMDVQKTSWLGFRGSPGAYHIELVLRQLHFQGGLPAVAYQTRDLINNNINGNNVSPQI